MGHFPPILKSVIYDHGTFSSHFWKMSHMTMGHFPPVSEKCHPWLGDIFLPFQKSITDDNGTFSSHFRKLSHMTIGHFPPVSKKCHRWVWHSFRKVSHMTSGHFPPVPEMCHTWLADIFLLFQISVTWLGDIFLPFQKSFIDDYGTFSSHFRKLSHISSGHFPPVSEKCNTWLLDIFLLF